MTIDSLAIRIYGLVLAFSYDMWALKWSRTRSLSNYSILHGSLGCPETPFKEAIRTQKSAGELRIDQ